MPKRRYELLPIPQAMSVGVPTYWIDFIDAEGEVTTMEVCADPKTAQALGEAWLAGNDVPRQLLEGQIQ